MKTIIEIQELATIGGGMITLETSGQYDIGYAISYSIATLVRLYGIYRITNPLAL